MALDLNDVMYEVCRKQKNCKSCPIKAVESEVCITGLSVPESPAWRKMAEVIVPCFEEECPNLVWMLDENLKKFLSPKIDPEFSSIIMKVSTLY